MLAELEMEAEALDTVDPGIVAEYREALEVGTIHFCVLSIGRLSAEILCRL